MIGVHVNRDHLETPEAPVYQYFLHNPRKGELLAMPKQISVPTAGGPSQPKSYVHGPYIDRLTAGKHQNEGIAERLLEATAAGASGYVVHVYAEPIGQILRALSRIFDIVDAGACRRSDGGRCVLYLEAHVVSGAKRDELVRQGLSQGRYIDPGPMGQLILAIRKRQWCDRVGLCIDTAHAWACGYNLANERTLFLYSAIPEVYGPPAKKGERSLSVFVHLNDSKQEFGDDTRDVHDALGRNLWSDHAALARAIACFTERGWDCIIEVGEGLAESYELAVSLCPRRSARAVGGARVVAPSGRE